MIVILFAVLAVSCKDTPSSRLSGVEGVETESLAPSVKVFAGKASAKVAVLRYLEETDPLATMAADPDTRGLVLDFFVSVTRSRRIAEPILEESRRLGISPLVAFSLAWVESEYNPRAVNRNPSSVDRGLFQLNSRSFPRLTEREFFDPVTNTKYGLNHLKLCLTKANNNQIVALAMYNAGHNRVAAQGAPRVTLEYISKFISYREGLERDFFSYISYFLEDTKPPASPKLPRTFIDIKRPAK